MPIGTPPPANAFSLENCPDSEILLVTSISPVYTMTDEGSTTSDISLDASNCSVQASPGHPALRYEIVRDALYATLGTVLEDLERHGQVVPGHGAFLGVASTPPVEHFPMVSYSLWRPVPHHYVFVRICAGPLLTRAERQLIRTRPFVRATQPAYVQKWWELFGSSVHDSWDEGAPGSRSIGRFFISVLLPPGAALDLVTESDSSSESGEGGERDGDLLVSSFTEEVHGLVDEE